MASFNFRKNQTLMKKLVVYFLIIIIMMFSLNAFLIFHFKSFYNSFYSMLTGSVELQSISTEMDSQYSKIESYAHSGSKNYIKNFSRDMDRLFVRVNKLQALSSEEPDVYYMFADIRNMMQTFNEKANDIIIQYDAGTAHIYINQMITNLFTEKGFAQDEIKDLQLVRLKGLHDYYSDFWIKIRSDEILMYILTALITALCLVFAFKFSKQISIPIHQLVLSLKRAAKGELDIEAVSSKTNDEISVLIDSFNHMITQLKNLIDKMREKADIERQLKEQEIKNLEISNLLNQSELNYLQSQINPHFLFNTLNSIVTLADIEEAGQTKLMIESMSNILRYNLRKINSKVTLKEELDIIRNYLYIQKTRYGNRLEYSFSIDESLLEYVIPSMIIQPFVENAILHGLEPKEGEGLLELTVRSTENVIEIMVRDNGAGMTTEKLEKINNGIIGQDSKRGIGMINVMRRLEIYYGSKSVSVNSVLGKGTAVIIRLPAETSA